MGKPDEGRWGGDSDEHCEKKEGKGSRQKLAN